MLTKVMAVVVVLGELVFAGWLVAPDVSRLFAAGRCLDHGGRWDYVHDACEGAQPGG